MLMHKFGREYAISVMENREGVVPARVANKLTIGTPSAKLVDSYLYEIAKGYQVDWTPPAGDDDDSPSGGLKEPAEADKSAEPQLEDPLLSEPLAKKVASDVAADVNVPKLPDIPPAEGEKTPGRTTPAPSAAALKKKSSEDDVQELAARFAALKKPR